MTDHIRAIGSIQFNFPYMEASYYTKDGKELKISTWIMIILLSGYLALAAACFTTVFIYAIYKATYEKNHSDYTGSPECTELPGTGIGTGH